MQWNGARPDPSRPAPLRSLMEILQQKAAPAVNEYGENQIPGYGGGLFNSIVRSGTEMTPGLGDLLGVEDLQTAAQNNDWGGIGLGILGAIPGIPAIGRTARGGRRARADSPLARMGEFMADSARAPSRTSVGQTEAEAALARYQAANPNDTGARVLSPGDEGYPTNAQWDGASQAYVAPRAEPPTPARAARPERAPSLRPAMKGTDGKIYTADDNHFTAMASMPEDVRRRVGLNDSYRGFVDDRGRYLNRARAQEYALNFGLLRDDAPSWARNNHELVSEYLRPYEPPAPIAPVEPDYPIRAFHGSPHSFDQFSLDAIGTGEGAQAYGHGLYFAESEDVARSYRDTLSTSINDGAQRRLEREGGNLDAAIAKAREMSERYRAGGAESYARAVEEDLRGLERYQQTGDWTPGSMYEVGINAHPDTFLDWDRPMAEQPESVRAALEDVLANVPGVRDNLQPYEIDTGPSNGANLMGAFSEARPGDYRTAMTDELRQRGVNGIRYLDGNSRGVGEGSSNYVVFNDELVKILRKYGISGLGLGTGTAAALGNELDRRGQAQEF